MGNRLCKNKKSDAVDNASPNVNNNNNRSPSKFDRIINRLHLTPATWKSESHLNKESKRSKSEERKKSESIFYTKPLSKSSDWTDVDLEVPSKEDEHIHLRNPKLNLIFDNEQGTPTPPPRQHKGTNFKEKLGKIARSGLQAIQGDRNNESNKVPVEEPLMVKRQINYKCPLCDSDEKSHNRDHHHHDHAKKQDSKHKDSNQSDSLKKFKNSKRKKNLSVISLPNYTDLKLSIADDSDLVKHKPGSKPDLNSSRLSLQAPGSKKLTSSQSTGKLDTYMTRCRSFGSILPQQLKKFMPQKPKSTDVTSDDSLAALEDWDLGLIEHYNPKDASLPRPRKPVAQRPSDSAVLSNIESLVVKEEDIAPHKPKVPGRKIESLVKKFNKESSNEAHVVRKAPEDICLTPPPSPVNGKQETLKNKSSVFTVGVDNNKNIGRDDFLSPKSTNILQNNSNAVDEEPVEHSSLMRILQEFSVKDKQQENATNVGSESNFSSLTPSLIEYEKNLNNSLVVEEFINAEKGHTRAVYS